MYRKRSAAPGRRGMILVAVLAFLTLFAIIGITFVLYSETVATSARYGGQAVSLTSPDMPPEECLALILGQIIYDVPDTTDASGNLLVNSALRGHSMARNMYGWNSAVAPLGNAIPFSGVGRPHFTYLSTVDSAAGPVNGIDEWQLINYTCFKSLDGSLLRDPEYFGIRNGTIHQYIGGANPPYTYPDLNNLFLGAVNATTGQVIARSYARDYTGFGPFFVSGALNPNWSTASVATTPATAGLKYMVLRPRPVDNPDPVTGVAGDPRGFPFPEDAGGDVKNLVCSPGYLDPSSSTQVNNDSFWINIGAPVLTAKDGRKYMMLVAPLIIDLDGKLNLAATGNIRGVPNGSLPTPDGGSVSSNFTHVSNQGFGPWEINPFQVLYGINPTSGTATWTNLYTGSTGPVVQGKYGPGQLPYWQSSTAQPGSAPHYYAQVDFDGCKSYSGPGTGQLPVTAGITLPAATGIGKPPFPTFPAGYENGSTTAAGNPSYTERTDHPLLFDVFTPFYLSSTIYNRRFPASDMERLLRFGDTGYASLTSSLEQLTPENFNAYDFASNTWDGTLLGTSPVAGINGQTIGSSQRRFMVTTHSADVIFPGETPFIWDPSTSGYGYAVTTTDYSQAPAGGPLSYGDPSQPTRVYGVAPTAAPSGGEYGSDYRAKGLALGPGVTGSFNAPSPGYEWPTSSQVQTALSRIDLNRRLTPYPLYDTTFGYTPGWSNPQSGNTYNIAFTGANLTIAQQALADRQKFANDIYRRLLAVTGVPPAANPSAPTDAELAPRRWLAQLAVNMVDYIDEDDIMTTFCFYNKEDDPTGTIDITNATIAFGTVPSNAGAPPQQELTRFWVVGTELPKVVLNEVSIQADVSDATVSGAGSHTIAAWVELLNAVTQLPSQLTQAPGQPQDGYPIPLAPYQVVIAGGLYSAPTTSATATIPPSIGLTGNPLGTYNYMKAMTTAADFATTASTYRGTAGPQPQPAASLSTTINGQTVAGSLASPYIDVNSSAAAPTNTPYFILGPTVSGAAYKDFLQQSAATTVPTNTTVLNGTPYLKTANMQYTVASGYTLGSTGDPTKDERGTGLAVLLRRLANPHLPFQDDPTQANWNPYVTVDYMSQVPIIGQDLTTPRQSRGKLEPYAGQTYIQSGNPASSPVRFDAAVSMTQEQNTNDPNLTWFHTFGQKNNPTQSGLTKYDWLVHLDRQVASPMELLHVSTYPPYQLTQRFMDVSSGTKVSFGHTLVSEATSTSTPGWFDDTKRLYRIFEFMDTGSRGAGIAKNGRAAGKMNINTMFDLPLFHALVDANKNANSVTSNGIADTIWTNMLQGNALTGFGRTPYPTGTGGSPALPRDIEPALVATLPTYYKTGGLGGGPLYDRPFLSLATGQSTGVALSQFPNNRGIDDTILRSFTASTGKTGRVFQNPTDYTGATPPHPYLQYQLLSKIFNNVTTRSNVFAVWLTVGFFEVTDATTIPPKLGAEIGKAEGRNIRHRMFAIVDRTNLAAIQTNSLAPITVTDPDANGGQGFFRTTDMSTVIPAGPTTDPRTSLSWSLTNGMNLVFEPGTDNEETVTVVTDATTGKFVGEFHKSHSSGVPVIVRGNPGPWTRYDPRQDTAVVLHWNIIN